MINIIKDSEQHMVLYLCLLSKYIDPYLGRIFTKLVYDFHLSGEETEEIEA